MKIKKLIYPIRRRWDYYRCACGKRAWVGGFAIAMIRHAINEALCAIFGHDLVNEDWAGPDSGGMSATCKRCGRNWHTILY